VVCVVPGGEDWRDVPRMAVLPPYVAQLLLSRLERAGWSGREFRSHAAFLRSSGRSDLADAVEDGHAQLLASAAQRRAALPVPRISDDGNAETEIGADGAGSVVSEEMTAREAAEMLGVSARRVGQWLTAGALSGRKVGRLWVVERGSVVDLLEARGSAA
jgi:excisionase family DNA binding protein